MLAVVEHDQPRPRYPSARFGHQLSPRPSITPPPLIVMSFRTLRTQQTLPPLVTKLLNLRKVIMVRARLQRRPGINLSVM